MGSPHILWRLHVLDDNYLHTASIVGWVSGSHLMRHAQDLPSCWRQLKRHRDETRDIRRFKRGLVLRKLRWSLRKHLGRPPKPLPSSRRRALTISVPDDDEEHPPSYLHATKETLIPSEDFQTSSLQPRSRLLRIPFNVRIKIWQFVVGGHGVALFHRGRQLVHVLLSTNNTITPGNVIAMDIANLANGAYRFAARKRQPQITHLSGLLKTCRMIYTEAVPILYNSNTFLFLQNSALQRFRSSILPHRFTSIRSLHLHWQIRDAYTFSPASAIIGGKRQAREPWNTQSWEAVVDVMVHMPSLMNLSIFIQGPFRWTGDIVAMLRPLCAICFRNPNLDRSSFTVRVPWPQIIVLSDGVETFRDLADEDFPFRVVRPEVEERGRSGIEQRSYCGRIRDVDAGPEIGWRDGVFFGVGRDRKGYRVYAR